MFVTAFKPSEDAPFEPVEGVSISLNGYKGITDLNGSFMFEVDYGVYNYTVSKSGYVTRSGVIDLTQDLYIVQLVLEKATASVIPLVLGAIVVLYLMTRK